MFPNWRQFAWWLPLSAVDDGGGPADDGAADLDAPPDAGGTPPAEPAVAPGAGADVAAEMADAIRGALAPKKPDESAAAPPQDGAPPAAAAKPKPEEKPGEVKPPEKKEDRYTPTPDMGPKAQTRFKELVGELKTKDEAIARYEGQLKTAQDFIADAQSVGVGAPEFNEFFEYMGAVKRGDGAAAMRFLQREMDVLTKEFGIPKGPDDTSLLERYPDLKEAVEGYKITREHALELAQARAGGERTQRVSQEQARAEEQAAQAKQVEDAGIDEVAKWFSATAKQDIDFVRKKPLLLEQLPELVQGVSPKFWVAKVKAAYALLGKAAPPAREKPAAAPLRANAGGGTPESTSMLDAIRTGLMGQAGRK